MISSIAETSRSEEGSKKGRKIGYRMEVALRMSKELGMRIGKMGHSEPMGAESRLPCKKIGPGKTR